MKDINALTREEDRGAASTTSRSILTSLFMQLRKACLHTYLFDGAEPDVGATTAEDLIGASGKLAVLDSLLMSLFQKGHRCVLFSQFTSMLDIIVSLRPEVICKYANEHAPDPSFRFAFLFSGGLLRNERMAILAIRWKDI